MAPVEERAATGRVTVQCVTSSEDRPYSLTGEHAHTHSELLNLLRKRPVKAFFFITRAGGGVGGQGTSSACLETRRRRA